MDRDSSGRDNTRSDTSLFTAEAADFVAGFLRWSKAVLVVLFVPVVLVAMSSGIANGEISLLVAFVTLLVLALDAIRELVQNQL